MLCLWSKSRKLIAQEEFEKTSKKCIYCGAELEDDALFCDECGKKQELVKKVEVEQNAKKEAELKAKQEAEAKAKADADAIAEAAQKAKEEAEKQAQEAAEVKAKLEAERQAKAEEESRKEIRTKAEAEARVRTESEQKEKAEARAVAEKKAEKAAEATHLEKEQKKDEQKANPTYKAYASLILGILTWATSTTGLIIPLITMLLGIFLGVQALKTTKKKTAIAGLVLNGLMAVLVVAIMIA